MIDGVTSCGDEHQRPLEVAEEVGRDRRPRAGSSSGGRRRRRRRPCARAGTGRAPGRRRREMCSSARCSADSAFSRSVADGVRGAPDEHRIVEHQELGVEEIRVLGAGRRGDAGLDLLESARAPGRGRYRARSSSRSTSHAGTRNRRSRVPRLRTSALPTPIPGETPRPVMRMALPRRIRARRARRAPRAPAPRRRRWPRS